MPDVLRVVHYLNAFFGGLGGEEEAHTPVSVQPGALGPGRPGQALAHQGQIVATIICGYGYFADHEEAVVAQVRAQWQTLKPDVFIAGPAFRAGRYGLAVLTPVWRLSASISPPSPACMWRTRAATSIVQNTCTSLLRKRVL